MRASQQTNGNPRRRPAPKLFFAICLSLSLSLYLGAHSPALSWLSKLSRLHGMCLRRLWAGEMMAGSKWKLFCRSSLVNLELARMAMDANDRCHSCGTCRSFRRCNAECSRSLVFFHSLLLSSVTPAPGDSLSLSLSLFLSNR